MTFGYSGDINKLIEYLSNKKIRDLNILEPELDEIFLDLYRDGGRI